MAFKIQIGKDGPPIALKNFNLYPAFTYLPESYFERYPSIKASVPRNITELFKSQNREFIASDVVLEMMIDSYAYASWPHIAKTFNLHKKMETYSGYHPAWVFAHAATLWIEEMELQHKILPMSKFIKAVGPDATLMYPSEEQFNELMASIVPSALKRHGFDKVIEVCKEIPCWEDFASCNSTRKTDMARRWYHTRSQHSQISLEGYLEECKENERTPDFDETDLRTDVSRDVIEHVLVEGFMETLNEQDKDILRLRMLFLTNQEIAKVVGFKTHSAVVKRLQKMGRLFKEYAGEDYELDTYLKSEYRGTI